MDFATRRVTRDGELILLTPTEFKLLTALMRRYVWHLRQKVERAPENPQYIHNERGFGYRFEAA